MSEHKKVLGLLNETILSPFQHIISVLKNNNNKKVILKKLLENKNRNCF